MKTPVFMSPAQDIQQVDGQLGSRMIPAILLCHRLLFDIQAEQNGQGEVLIGAKGKPNDHAQYDPTVTSAKPGHLSSTDQRA